MPEAPQNPEPTFDNARKLLKAAQAILYTKLPSVCGAGQLLGQLIHLDSLINHMDLLEVIEKTPSSKSV